MKKSEQEKISAFQKKILLWYSLNQRDLPWRKTRNAYTILVSEIMLQQTQVTRVVPKFEAWMSAFPTVQALAKASVADVLALWSGLGYNRRALNLKKTAQTVVDHYEGIFPKTERELLSLPGIGPYTARAVLCFAYDKQVAVVDTNVRKVILTQFLHGQPDHTMRLGDASRLSVDEKHIASLADALLPVGKAYEWNQALMDYASAVLKKEKIPVQKQSTFLGSHRYYRGKILKELITRKTILYEDLGLLLKKDFTAEDEAWLNGLVKELTSEGFVVVTPKGVELSR